jgi:hypothetical protein
MSSDTLYAVLEAVKEVADSGILTAAEAARLEKIRS